MLTIGGCGGSVRMYRLIQVAREKEERGRSKKGIYRQMEEESPHAHVTFLVEKFSLFFFFATWGCGTCDLCTFSAIAGCIGKTSDYMSPQ